MIDWSPRPAEAVEVRWLNSRTVNRPYAQNPWLQDTVGAGWQAYARIFCEPTRAPNWASVANRSGKVMHPLVEWEKIGTGRDRDEGELPDDAWRALCDALSNATRTPDNTYCLIWDGRVPAHHPELAHLPLVNYHGMTCRLAEAPLSGVAKLSGWDQPDYLWPQDHAWTVMSHYDFEFLIVGGSRGLIDAILQSPELEALEVPAASRWGDEIN